MLTIPLQPVGLGLYFLASWLNVLSTSLRASLYTLFAVGALLAAGFWAAAFRAAGFLVFEPVVSWSRSGELEAAGVGSEA